MDDGILTDKEQQVAFLEEWKKEIMQELEDEPWKAVPIANFIKGISQNPDKAKQEIIMLQYKIDTVLALINKTVNTSRDRCRNGVEEIFWDLTDDIKRTLEEPTLREKMEQ